MLANMSVNLFCRSNGACRLGYRFAREYDSMHACYEGLLQQDHAQTIKWAMWVASCPDVLTQEQRRDLSEFLLRDFLRLKEDVVGGEPTSVDYIYLSAIAVYMKEEVDPAVYEVVSKQTDQTYHTGLTDSYERKDDKSPLAAYCAGYHAWRGNPYETFDALMKIVSCNGLSLVYSRRVRGHLIKLGNVFDAGPVDPEIKEDPYVEGE